MHTLRTALGAWLALWLGIAVGQAQPTEPAQVNPVDRTAPTKEFRPGIRIDWHKPAVEIEARVVLRTGPLELLACSPQTREHESILTVAARPRDIYYALGLIGAEAGSPIQYDEAADRLLPPTGQSLELHIRYRHGGARRTVRARRWLSTPEGAVPGRSIRWVFAGSTTLETGRFAADTDGTVVCLVDFDSALITIDGLHTADNAALWLHANTSEIPPLGTKCILIVTVAGQDVGIMTVTLGRDGLLRLADKVVSPAEAVAALKRSDSAGNLLIRPQSGGSKAAIDAAIAGMVEAGLARSAIRVGPSPPNEGASQRPASIPRG